jgi:tungstate transport system ATP-binding protein
MSDATTTPRAVTLSATGLRRTFPKGSFALDVPAIEVPAGGVLALLGPSGSGKSTLLGLLGLLDKPDAGTVLLDGAEVTTRDRAARLTMAAVFQRPYLFKGTVGANVAYGLAARGVPRAQRAPRVAAALERVGLAGYESRSALSLSGGEAQRVSLARALVVEPRVLLLDEPLASLDPLLKRRLTRDFASILREAGVTVVYVTHDHDEALVVADEVAVMNAGRVVASGPADEVMSLPGDEWMASFLGIEEASQGVVVSADEGLVTIAVGEAEVVVSGDAEPGTRVVLAVRPEDVLLFEEGAELPATTARNRVAATVVSVNARGASNHVVLEAGGLRLAASVSRASTAELALAPGVSVRALFKATAVRWRPSAE